MSNNALLLKQAWRRQKDDDSILAELYLANYKVASPLEDLIQEDRLQTCPGVREVNSKPLEGRPGKTDPNRMNRTERPETRPEPTSERPEPILTRNQN